MKYHLCMTLLLQLGTHSSMVSLNLVYTRLMLSITSQGEGRSSQDPNLSSELLTTDRLWKGRVSLPNSHGESQTYGDHDWLNQLNHKIKHNYEFEEEFHRKHGELTIWEENSEGWVV